MYGFAPAHAVSSVGSYVFYFCCPSRILQDPKTEKAVPTSVSQTATHLLNCLGLLLLTGMYQSLFVLLDWFPNLGAGPESTPANYYKVSSMWDVSDWKENILVAILFQLYLSAFSEGLIFATNLLSGKRTVKFSDNPMFESTSPSDFWGRRWNLIVHDCLKHGVYKPVRSLGGHASVAVAASFLASGMFHEWLLPAVFYDYPSTHGVTLLFFMWQAMLVVSEAVVGRYFRPIGQALPRLLRTALVILLGLPLAHWFCDTYIRSSFFLHGQQGLFMILPH